MIEGTAILGAAVIVAVIALCCGSVAGDVPGVLVMASVAVTSFSPQFLREAPMLS